MTYTEVFDCGTGLPGLGSFSVRFRPGSQIKLLGPHVASTGNGEREGPTQNWANDTLVVTPGRLGADVDRATLLDAAIYSGELLRFRAERGGSWSATGVGILNWLGDSENKGPAVGQGTDYTNASQYTGTLADYLLALWAGGWSNGITFDATDASVPTSACNCAVRDMGCARERINTLCTVKEVEYWMYPDGSCVFAGIGDDAVFVQTPKVLFARGVGYSREASLVSFPCEIIPDLDYGPVASDTFARTSDGVTNESSVAPPGSAKFPNDFTGTSAGVRTKFLGASDELLTQPVNPEQYRRRDTIDIEIGSQTIRQDVKPGDYVYVHDPMWGLIDTANAVIHAGRTMAPIKRRVSEMTSPITRENGVYVLHQNSAYGGTNAVQAVHDQVMPDTGPTTVRLATGSPRTLKAALLGSQWRQRWDQT